MQMRFLLLCGPSLKSLNSDLKGKAIIKYIEYGNSTELLSEMDLEITSIPAQILINSSGLPYDATESEALGYKKITDASGSHMYTVHYGDLTLYEMRDLLEKMGMK